MANKVNPNHFFIVWIPQSTKENEEEMSWIEYITVGQKEEKKSVKGRLYELPSDLHHPSVTSTLSFGSRLVYISSTVDPRFNK